MKAKLGFALAFFLSTNASAEIVDLSSWEQHGFTNNSGDWSLSSDGYSVVQNINGGPTFLVNNNKEVDVEYNGQIIVETNSDDDWIGFVLGFNGLEEFYLFDWKKHDQDAGLEGFTLSRITGPNVNFATHSGRNGGIEVLATNYGSGLGWESHTRYHYNVGYTQEGIAISIDGGKFDHQEIFNLSGFDNVAGSFGFYNLSQSGVRYMGSSGEECTSLCGSVQNLELHTVPASSTWALLGLSMAGLSVRRKQ